MLKGALSFKKNKFHSICLVYYFEQINMNENMNEFLSGT